MLARMVLGVVCLLTVMLQSSLDNSTRPVRMIEGFGVGSGPDLVARALTPKLSELWHQLVSVENHPGAGSTAAPRWYPRRLTSSAWSP